MNTNNYSFWLIQDHVEGYQLQFPKLPEEILIGNKSKNSTVDIKALGEVTIVEAANLFEISFSSEFPVAYYPGCAYQDIPDPQMAVEIIEAMKRTSAVRFIATEVGINLPVTIEEFSLTHKGGDVGTIYFDITLKEYRYIAPRKINETKTRKDSRPKTKTYTVVRGDTLWIISKKVLGDGSRWKEIYNLNKEVLKSPTNVQPKQVLKMPS